MKSQEPPIAEKYKRAIIANMEEKADQTASLTSARIKQIDIHRKQGELLLAKARGDVIEKSLSRNKRLFC